MKDEGSQTGTCLGGDFAAMFCKEDQMIMRKLILSIALTAALAGMTTGAFAQETKATNAPATNAVAAPKLQRLPFRAGIESVDPVAKTVTLRGEQKQVLYITSKTKIVKDGKAATFESLTPGTKVQGMKGQTKDGEWEAVTLKIADVKAATPGAAPAKPQ